METAIENEQNRADLHATELEQVSRGSKLLDTAVFLAGSQRPKRGALRALETVLMELLTRSEREGAPRLLKPGREVDDLLRRILRRPDSGLGGSAVRQYTEIADEALSCRSMAKLLERKCLSRARDLKYELGGRYLSSQVLQAAVQCMLVIEHLAAEPGFCENPEEELEAWIGGRLPQERDAGTVDEEILQLMEATTRSAAARSSASVKTARPHDALITGSTRNGSSESALEEASSGSTPPSTTKNAVSGTAQDPELAADNQDEGLVLDPSSWCDNDVVHGTARTPSPPGGEPPRADGAEAAPDRSQEVNSRSTDARPRCSDMETLVWAPKRNPRIAARTRSPRLRRSVSAQPQLNRYMVRIITVFSALCLLFIAVTGSRVLLEGSPSIEENSDKYQAYFITEATIRDYFTSARRVDDVLVLVSSDAWHQLSAKDRRDLASHLARQLIGKDRIGRVVVLDPSGRELANASKLSVKVLETQTLAN